MSGAPYARFRRCTAALVILALAIVPSASAGGFTQAELERLSRAASTTKDYSGRPDLDVLQTRNPVQKTPAQAPRKPTPEELKVQELQAQRQRGRQEHLQQLQNLGQGLTTLQTDLAKEKQRLATGKANLASYEKNETWYEAAGDALLSLTGSQNQGTRARKMIEDATVRIEQIEAQITNQRTAIQQKQKDAVAYDQRLNLEIVKTDPTLRAQELERRSADVITQTQGIETQKAQIAAGEEQFEQHIASLNGLIKEAKRLDPKADVSKFENDIRMVTEAHEAWRASMDSELTGRMKTREQTYQQNRDDGIGETNTGMVRHSIRKRIRTINEDASLDEKGKQSKIDELALVDEAAESATKKSALSVAQGAPNNTEWKSIFLETNSESLNEFIADLADDDLSWYEFSLRMGAYTKGTTRAGVDALKDLLTLIVEAGDTGGETLEALLEKHLGIRSDLFGSENLRLLTKLRDKSAILLDLDNPEGDKLAKELMALAERAKYLAERAVEKRSQGDVKKRLEEVGYVTGTVVGAEAAVFKTLGLGAKVVRGLPIWGPADDIADAATAAGKLPDAPPSGRTPTGGTPDAPTKPPDYAGGTPDTPTKPPDYAGGTPDTPTKPPDYAAGDKPATGQPKVENPGIDTEAPTGFDAEAPTGLDGPRRRNDAGSTGQAPTNDLALGRFVDGDLVLRRPSDGAQMVLKERVGSGYSTDVYGHPTRKDLVVRFTETADGAHILDDAGYKVIKNIDPKGQDVIVPTRHASGEAFAPRTSAPGGTEGIIEVVDRAPDSWAKMKAKTGAQEMPPALRDAYRRGLDKLNAEGFVVLDMKSDNYTFKMVELPDGSQRAVLVILDPGSIVPMRNLDADAARRLQKALDTPGDRARTGDWETKGRLEHMEWLAKHFDGLIDWEALKRLGFDYTTLGKGAKTGSEGIFPYNPKNGVQNPELANPTPSPNARPRTGDTPAADKPGDAKRPPFKRGELVPEGLGFPPGYRWGDALDGVPAPSGVPKSPRPKRAETGKGGKDGKGPKDTREPGPGDASDSHPVAKPEKGPGLPQRSPYRDLDKDDDKKGGGNGGGTAIAIGGFDGMAVIDPIHFAFGGSSLPPTISTDCPPCSHYVSEYNQLMVSPLRSSMSLAVRLQVIRQALATCEAFYCSDSDEDGYSLEILNVNTLFDGNPYDARDPLEGGDNTSFAPPGFVAVLPGLFSDIPISQFTSVSGPDACPDDHFHQGDAPGGNVIDCFFSPVTDNDPFGCGFGSTEDVEFVPKPSARRRTREAADDDTLDLCRARVRLRRAARRRRRVRARIPQLHADPLPQAEWGRAARGRHPGRGDPAGPARSRRAAPARCDREVEHTGDGGDAGGRVLRQVAARRRRRRHRAR